MNTPVLETERLLLRKFNENDLEALFRIYSDVEVNRFLPWFPLKTMEEARAFWQKQFGYIGVSMEEPHDFGYGLCKEYWHRGIMTEAGRAVIERVKADGMPYITATHDRENPSSGGVMIRLGMKYQYSYEEQWQPKDISVIFRLYQLNFDEEQNRVYRGYWNHSDVHFVEKDCTVQNREG